MVNPRKMNSNISEFIKKILICWSSEKISTTYSHGIPQGPISSSFIGELIFLDIDKKMMKYSNEIDYVRYVDDVRLFSINESKVREGLVYLEQECRKKGLIPQSKKTSIFYANNVEQALGKNISLTSEEFNISTNDFLKIVDIEKNKIIDISKFKYFLYKGPPLIKYLDLMLHLFENNPDLSDAFFVYLSNFLNNDYLINYLVDLLIYKKSPYQYVEGNIWLLLGIVDFYRKSFPKLLLHAKDTLLNPKINLYLRYGLLTYLIPVGTQLGKRIFNKYLYEESIILGLLLPEIIRNFEPNNYIKVIKQALIRSKLEAPLVGVFLLAYENIKYYGLKISNKIKTPTRNCLITLGLAKSQSIPEVTPFQEILNTRFNLNICNWKKYLKKDFSQTHHILIIAEKAFDSNSSSWLCLMDSINYIVVRNIIK